MKKRFQESSKLIQIWRYRYYLQIPFIYISTIFRNGNFKHSKLIWKLLIGDAQIKMNWVYTEEEVFNKIRTYTKKR